MRTARRPPWASALELAVCLAPAALLGWLVSGVYVEIPVLDERFFIPFFRDVAAGNSLWKLVSGVGHVGVGGVHRIEVPLLILTGLAFATGWRIKAELFLSITVAAGTFLAMRRLAFVTSGGIRDRRAFVANLLTSLFVFSLAQSWNWLWGYAFLLFFVNACVVVAVLLLASSGTPVSRGRLLLAGLCCFLASFSMAHGTASWLALLPLITYLANRSGRRLEVSTVWLGLLAGTWILFLRGYGGGQEGQFLSLMAEHPVMVVSYFLALLGSPVAYFASVRGTLVSAGPWTFAAAGGAMLAAYAVLSLRLLLRAPERFGVAVRAWMSVGLFGILYAGMNTVGRAQAAIFSESNAWLSMYSTPPMLLTVSVIHLASLVSRGGELPSGRSQRSGGVRAAAAGAMALVVVAVLNFWVVFPRVREAREASRSLECCFELLDYFHPQSGCAAVMRIFESARPYMEGAGRPAFAGSMVAALEELGFRQVSRGVRFASPEEGGTPFGSIAGARVSMPPQGHFLPPHEMLAWRHQDVVLEGTVGPSADAGRIGAVLLTRGDEESFIACGRADRDGRWRSTISWAAFPAGVSTLKAWAYDRERARFVPLEGEIAVERVGGEIVRTERARPSSVR